MSAIVVAESVSKRFRIHRNRPLTLKEAMIRRFREGNTNGAGAFWALRDVSFSVEQGRSLGIIGHNGAGKSTLLRLLCGLGRPTLGTIRRTGRAGSLLELGIGFHPERTGRENLLTGGMLSGLTKQEVQAREDEIIAFAEIEEFIDQPVRIYSTGMYLRLAFATAVHFGQEFVVVDDVLAVGDSRFQKKCLDRLKALRGGGTSFIIVTHTLDEVRRLCDDVLVLDEGRLVMQGDPESAITCYDDLMHQRTEKRAAQVHGGSAPGLTVETGARLGTQEASIDSARLCDAEGKTIETLHSGESLTIELEYSITKPIADMAIFLEICSEANVKCFETVIPSFHKELGNISEKGKIRCRIPELPLFSGLYHVSLGLHAIDGSFVYDHHWQRLTLHVVDAHGTPSNTRGVVRVRPDWSISPDNGLFRD